MNKLIMTTLVATALVSTTFVTASAEERRQDTATYRLEEATTPGAGSLVPALEDTSLRAMQIAVPAPLADLRARHANEMAGMEAALAASRDQAERESLERQAMELKLRQQREELSWLKEQAVAKGDAAYAERLDQAQRELAPKAAPVATVFVPRDPATGEALGAQEGGAK